MGNTWSRILRMMKRYFVTKCANLESLRKALEDNVWACNDRKYPPQPKEILAVAFKDCEEVVLLFSVNNQRGWHGYAVMLSAPGLVTLEAAEDSEQGTPWHYFKMEWKTIYMKEFGEQCLPFEKTAHLTLGKGNDCELPVNMTRNFDELPEVVGEEMCSLMAEHYEWLLRKREEKVEAKLIAQPDPFFSPENSSSIDDVWKKLISKVEAYGKILLACPFGSQRYNLSTPDSDMDMFIVYAADTKDVLGFTPPLGTYKNRESETCDYTILEVHRYCELLLGGDPKCVETLFMEPSTICYADPAWMDLCHTRSLFLTRECMDKYLRDAQGSKGIKYIDRLQQQEKRQVKKMQKVSYVVVRLLQNALDISEGNDLEVYRSEKSENFKILRSIRTGDMEIEKIQELISSLTQSITASKDTMPSTDNEEANAILSDWLLRLRYDNFKQYMESKVS